MMMLVLKIVGGYEQHEPCTANSLAHSNVFSVVITLGMATILTELTKENSLWPVQEFLVRWYEN
jgi:hypothetical protein